MDSMQLFELIIGMLLAIIALHYAARRLGLPPSVALLAGGALLAFLPGLPEIELEPDLVLVIFLPPLLMDGAWFIALGHLKRQMIGIASMFLPVALGLIGLNWMRSRPAGSPLAKSIGAILWTLFGPAMFALLPGHLHWKHALPIEGITGRLLADALVHFLNFPGACIVTALMVGLSLYLATTFTFNTARDMRSSASAGELSLRRNRES